MKVAYYSPLPPERSGVADYSALLVPELAQHVDLHVQKRGRRRPARGADVSIYHVGNNPDVHGWIVEALRRRIRGCLAVRRGRGRRDGPRHRHRRRRARVRCVLHGCGGGR